MPRYIDADALKLPSELPVDPYDDPYFRGMYSGWNNALKECKEQIDSAPTVSHDEVGGVVHCRNCYHAEPRNPVGEKTEIFCRLFIAGMREDDFCSHGKFLTNCGAEMKGADA